MLETNFQHFSFSMNFFEYLTLFLNLKFVVTILFIIVLLKYLSKKCSRDPILVTFAEKMPGPYAYPLVGNTLSVLFDTKEGFEPLFSKYLSKYGPVARLWLGSGLGVLLSDPQEVETAISNSNCLSRSPGNDTFSILFGNSLLITSPVSLWKQKRREFQPFFNRNNLVHHIPAMNEMIYRFIEKMKNAVDGPEGDWMESTNDLSFDIFTKTYLNYELTDEEKTELDLTDKLHLSFLQLSVKWLFPSKFTDVISKCVGGTDIPKLRKKLIVLIDKILKSNRLKKLTVEAEKVMEKENSNIESFSQSFIEMLAKMEKEIDEDYLVHGELSFLFMAGSDTISIAISNCLLALAANPEIQEKVYHEIYQVFGDDEKHAEKSDLEKLPYLNQVIKETLRVFTVVPAMYRRIETDAQIGDRIYPKGTFIVVNITGIHHDPKLYPDPYRFNPENFSEEAVSKRHRYSFIPFGAGPRNCLGKEYAEQNLKLRLIALLRTFSFHTSVKLENVKFKLRILETMSTGYPMSIKLRKKSISK